MLFGKYRYNDIKERTYLRIVYSGHSIWFEILTNTTFWMTPSDIECIERRWNCSYRSMLTYKPRLTDIFSGLGKPEYDDNFIRIYFNENDEVTLT
jgi:hypothetical protein